MEPQKISFSFTKSFKKPNIPSTAATKENEKRGEIIECLEEQSIKIKHAVIKEVQPLVIPLKDDKKNLLDRIKAAKKWDKKEEKEDKRPDSELTADELAARQLVRDAKTRLENGHKSSNNKVSVLPLTEEPSLTGEKEPTLEDYESVPIGDYGLALLRGMGWKDGMPIGKNITKSAAVSIPELRPKGLGLGATKIEVSEKKATDKDGNELILLKGGFAKIIAGSQNGNYCEIQGFDEEAGRVIIKVYPKGDIININELMLVPVTKEEFSRGSKVLNNAKFEKYKHISDKKLESLKVKKEKSDSEDSEKYNKAATSSKLSKKRLPSSESDYETSKYSHKSKEKNRLSRSRSKDKSKKKLRSNLDKDKSQKRSRSRSTNRSDRDRSDSRSKSKDRNSKQEKYKTYSRSRSKDKKRDKKDRKSRSRSDKERKKSRSRSQEKKKSKTTSNKDKRSKSSSDDISDEDDRKSRSRSKKSRNKSKDKSSHRPLRHKSSRNRSGSSEQKYSKERKKKSNHKSKKDRHSSEDGNRSRSISKDKQSKNKKSRDSSYSSESDHKKDKRRKNKCKSRHRQASSSSSEDRKYRKKK